VKVKYFNLARLLRDRIQQIPRKVAPQIVAAVVAQPDQRVVEDLLMEAIREALEELSR
jgi:DNA-binding protein YbaB